MPLFLPSSQPLDTPRELDHRSIYCIYYQPENVLRGDIEDNRDASRYGIERLYVYTAVSG